LEAKKEAITAMVIDPQSARLGDFQTRVDYALGAMDEQAFVKRLWQRDPSLWKQNQDGEKVILNRLGWMNVVETMLANVSEIESFAKEVKDAGFTQAVLMGMGGSSLSPEVSRLTFGIAEGYPDLMVLDSTVPATVSEIDRMIDPAKTLFIVSTKSGTTVETLSAYSYFMERVKAAKGDRAGENFAAITDPDTPLQSIAKEMGFRKVFTNFQDIGGRYSALSYFGIVPAAVIGADANIILQRAARMVEASQACIPPVDNPGVELGAIMAVVMITFLCDNQLFQLSLRR
jgi:glucose-6-phosphate isomerase